jgi:ATP-binding cassette subfamily B protein
MSLRSFFSSSRPSRRTPNTGKPPLSLKDRFQALRTLPQFFGLIWETSPFMTVANLLLRLLRSAIPVALLYVGKLIIDEVVRLTQLDGEQELSYVWTLLATEFGIALLSDMLSRGITLLDGLLGDLFSIHTSVKIMQHAARLDLDRFEDAAFYDRFERARQQTAGRIRLMSNVLTQVQDSITMGFLAIGLIAFNPWLIVLLAVTLIPAFLGESHFNVQSYSFLYDWTPERRQLEYLRYTGTSDETAKEVKMFGLSRFLTERFQTLSERFYEKNRTLSLQRTSWGVVFAMVGSVGYYAAYVVIIIRTVSGQLSLGDLTFLAGSFSRLQTLLQDILNRFTQVADGALYLRDLFDFFELQPRVTSPTKPRPFPRPIQDGFHFDNVGFQYINSDRWAVRHVSFRLRAGERLALVGENGAGKTTVIKLLSRLYDPTEGRILLDGYDLREYDLHELRQEIGIIFQDFVRYQMTAADNIAVGRIDAREDRPRIALAAERSQADAVIQKLPDKYDQIVGKRFASGVELSGGEWQKIALARAYMREAQVLVLDEPTSGLDARAEHAVFQRFADLTRGKAAILISHRFSTVRMADRILVLDNGQTLEMGTHDELLTQAGRYAELFNLQAAGYR